jgi:polyisoprenoid-binding protein YceI
VGDDPKPRLGGFRAFSGTIELNEDDTAIRKIAVQFEIDSIWTEFDNLTAHLKTADFFDVATFPRAAFSSESISGPDATGTVTVTGKLILHGVSSELSFDCQPTLANRTLNLQGKFTIDRTKFGMDKMTEGVEPEVTVEVTVGPSGPHGKSPVPSTTTPARKQGD